MAENEVEFSSANNNTLVAIALVAAILSLALNFYTLTRTNELAAIVAVERIKAAKSAAAN